VTHPLTLSEELVKPLEWIERSGPAGIFDAASALGNYRLDDAFQVATTKGMRLVLPGWRSPFDITSHECPSLAEAKAAAQADYAKRILGALSDLALTALRANSGEVTKDAVLEEAAKDREDAARWRALMASDKMHFMGCAGFDFANKPGTTGKLTQDQVATPKDGKMMHFGMEFWWPLPGERDKWPDDFERAFMVTYVDEIRRRSSLKASQS
jgi:hypothetical protein